MIRKTIIALSLVCLTAGMTDILAQDVPTLGPDDYDQWESLGNGVLSPSGNWLAVLINRVSDEDELRIHRTDTDSSVVVSFGTRPVFSSDGAWLAYMIGVSPDERAGTQLDGAIEPEYRRSGGDRTYRIILIL